MDVRLVIATAGGLKWRCGYESRFCGAVVEGDAAAAGKSDFRIGLIYPDLIALWGLRLGLGSFLGYSTEDVQYTVMFLLGIPILVVVLPTMFGSTAAAGEKPLDVLAWQSALPVARWKVILAKCLVAAASVVIVVGVFPYIWEVELEEPGFLQRRTSGFWIGLFGLLFCAIGFFAGSHAKDDYQGLMVAVIPAVVVIISLLSFDVSGKVIPVGLPSELTRPWAVVVRLLAMMALLVVLAVPMHIRVPVRRWWPMAGRLAMVFVAGLVLTAWNLHVESTVLKTVPREAETGIIRTDDRGRRIVEPVVVGEVRRGYNQGFTKFVTDQVVDLQSGKRVALLPVLLASAKRNEFSAMGTVLVKSDGMLSQFPNGVLSRLAGVSADQRWILHESDSFSVLIGPWSILIPLFIMPETVSDLILRSVGMDYVADKVQWHASDRTRETTTTLANGQVMLNQQFDAVPAIETTDGPATVEVYRLSNTEPSQSGSLVPVEFGVLVRNLVDGTTTPLTILRAADADDAELESMEQSYCVGEWSHQFQVLSIPLGNHLVVLDFSQYGTAGPERVMADAVWIRLGDMWPIVLSSRRVMLVDYDKFYLAEW